MNEDFISGYVERKKDGDYSGVLKIDGVDLSPIVATLFRQDGNKYLWLRRKDIMEYDYDTSSFITRKREPQWECYLESGLQNNSPIMKGQFIFLRFKYSITGVWDVVIGEKQRINLFVERLPLKAQTLLNEINERKRNDDGGK